jgi:hypothetical protein
MKYMMLLFNEEQGEDMSPDAMAQADPAALGEAMAPWIKFGEDAKAIGKETSSEALQPSGTATVVSVRNGKTITTDGPFIDTKEQLGGFYVFDCPNLDDAIKLASMIPWAPTGHIEVRPVMDYSSYM